MSTSGFAHLHDGTFKSLRVEQAAAECVAEIELADRVVSLVWRGVQTIAMSHTQPWGPSGSVNSLKQTGSSYVLELQSGDTLHVVADSLEVR